MNVNPTAVCSRCRERWLSGMIKDGLCNLCRAPVTDCFNCSCPSETRLCMGCAASPLAARERDLERALTDAARALRLIAGHTPQCAPSGVCLEASVMEARAALASLAEYGAKPEGPPEDDSATVELLTRLVHLAEKLERAYDGDGFCRDPNCRNRRGLPHEAGCRFRPPR